MEARSRSFSGSTHYKGFLFSVLFVCLEFCCRVAGLDGETGKVRNHIICHLLMTSRAGKRSLRLSTRWLRGAMRDFQHLLYFATTRCPKTVRIHLSSSLIRTMALGTSLRRSKPTSRGSPPRRRLHLSSAPLEESHLRRAPLPIQTIQNQNRDPLDFVRRRLHLVRGRASLHTFARANVRLPSQSRTSQTTIPARMKSHSKRKRKRGRPAHTRTRARTRSLARIPSSITSSQT